MGQYASVTAKRMYQFLKWLGGHTDAHVTIGGRHPTKVTCPKTGQSYPLPISHAVVNKHIVKDFMEWLVKNDICTKDQFDEKI